MQRSKKIVLISILFFQACSTTDQINKTPPNDDIKTISQNIVDMGRIPNTVSEPPLLLNNKATNDESLIVTDKIKTQEETQYQQFLAQQLVINEQLPVAVQSRYQKALTEMKNKNWQNAIILLDKVIKQTPNLSNAYLNKALAYYYLKQVDSAMRTLLTAEKITKNNPYLYNLKGVIAREKGLFIQAEAYYKQALVLWPDYANAHLNIAVLYELYRGNFDKAKTHYQAYLLLFPDDQQTKKWLAGLHIKIALREGS